MKVTKPRVRRNPRLPLPLFVWADHRDRHALPVLPSHIPQTLALARKYRIAPRIAAIVAEALEARQ